MINVSYLRTKIIATTMISNTPTMTTTAPATTPAVGMLSVSGAAARVAFATGNRENQSNCNRSSIDINFQSQ